MVETLKQFAARNEHRTSDSTFLVLMSHGVRAGLCGTNCQDESTDILPIDTIYSTFNNRNCQALLEKPKVIIIQACRGGEPALWDGAGGLPPGEGHPLERGCGNGKTWPDLGCNWCPCFPENHGQVWVSDSAELPGDGSSLAPLPPEGLEDDASHQIHVESDFICFQATTPGNWLPGAGLGL